MTAAAGNIDPERLGRLEVDRRFELRGLLDRQITWFRAFEDPIDDDRGPCIQPDGIEGVGDEATLQHPQIRAFFVTEQARRLAEGRIRRLLLQTLRRQDAHRLERLPCLLGLDSEWHGEKQAGGECDDY